MDINGGGMANLEKTLFLTTGDFGGRERENTSGRGGCRRLLQPVVELQVKTLKTVIR